jgi:hypothetical protein
MNIFIHHDGQQLGPFGEAEIKSQLAAGTISRQDLAWWDGQAGWVPLEQTFLAVESTPPASISSPAVSPATTPAMPAARVASTPMAQTDTTSGMAIGSLVCGVASFLVGITFIVAIILGHLSLSEIKRHPGMKGRGMAITGLILGYFWPVLAFGSILVLMALGSQVKSTFQTINAQLEMAQTNNASGTNAAPANGQ